MTTEKTSETENMFDCSQIFEYNIYAKKSYSRNQIMLKQYLACEIRLFWIIRKFQYRRYINMELNRILRLCLKISNDIRNIFSDYYGRKLFQAFSLVNTDLTNNIFNALKCYDISNYILTRTYRQKNDHEYKKYSVMIYNQLKKFCILEGFNWDSEMSTSAIFERKNIKYIGIFIAKVIEYLTTSTEFKNVIQSLENREKIILKILILLKKLESLHIKYVKIPKIKSFMD